MKKIRLMRKGRKIISRVPVSDTGIRRYDVFEGQGALQKKVRVRLFPLHSRENEFQHYTNLAYPSHLTEQKSMGDTKRALVNPGVENSSSETKQRRTSRPLYLRGFFCARSIPLWWIVRAIFGSIVSFVAVLLARSIHHHFGNSSPLVMAIKTITKEAPMPTNNLTGLPEQYFKVENPDIDVDSLSCVLERMSGVVNLLCLHLIHDSGDTASDEVLASALWAVDGLIEQSKLIVKGGSK